MNSDKEPCGECHLQAGETCDICGAAQPQPPSRNNTMTTVLSELCAEYGRHATSLPINSKRRNLWSAAYRVRDNNKELLDAAIAAERLLDSVAFVAVDGDTDEPLRMLRAAIAKATGAA